MSNQATIRLKQGLSDLGRKRYKEVHADALEMIRCNVRDAVPYCLLGTIAAAHGNHGKALDLFDRAAELEPENPYYQAHLGKALTTLGEQNRAKAAADLAASLAPDDAHLNDMIGVIYSRTGFHEKAIHFFQKAVARDSGPANFYYNLGASLQFLGRFDEAKRAFGNTLERDPRAYRAWSSLVGLEPQTEDANSLGPLTLAFEEHGEDADARLHLGHAIAKTLEDLGRYEESLEWLHKAKALKRAARPDEDGLIDDYFRAARTSLSKPPATGNANDPVFVVGLPRTGTTLIDRILSSHSRVTAAGELNVFPSLIKEAAQTKSNLVMDAETLALAADIDLQPVGNKYIELTRELTRGADRFTDKMPLNFFYAGLIHGALPKARIVALRRGAMDSCLSNYRQLLTVQHSYYGYTFDLESVARFYRRFDDLMAFWRAQLPADRFMEIRYEDVVLNQEVETRRLLAFCGLDWEEQCLRFHENEAPVSTASSVQVRQPLYSGSIGRWKRYGDKLDGLRTALGDLAD